MKDLFERDNDYPKVVSVSCAICGAKVDIAIELQIGTPKPDGGRMKVPIDPTPTVLAGCEHFYEPPEG